MSIAMSSPFFGTLPHLLRVSRCLAIWPSSVCWIASCSSLDCRCNPPARRGVAAFVSLRLCASATEESWWHPLACRSSDHRFQTLRCTCLMCWHMQACFWRRLQHLHICVDCLAVRGSVWFFVSTTKIMGSYPH